MYLDLSKDMSLPVMKAWLTANMPWHFKAADFYLFLVLPHFWYEMPPDLDEPQKDV